jgi:DMSO/TMAO reductase YedYZ molybdopterin-dependent catalytic subunit
MASIETMDETTPPDVPAPSDAPANVSVLSPRVRLAFAALAGVVAAIAAVAVAEVLALVLGTGEPFTAVGSLVIDLTPAWLKDAVIAAAGTGDKIVLGAVLAVLALALSAAAGVLEYRRPPYGAVLLALIAAVVVLAAATRADSGQLAPAPAGLGTVAAVYLLRTLIGRLRDWARPLARSEQVRSVAADPRAVDRRRFLTLLIGAGASAAVVAAGARAVSAATTVGRRIREAVTLPAPASAAPVVPAGADFGIDGLSPFLTPNADFYRIDTALSVPDVDPASWSLTITGLVEEEVTLSWDDVLALPMVERIVTLSCVSNEVGGDLIGNARWLGFPIRELLARARPTADADMVLSRSVDGFTAGTPLEVMQDEGTDALLAIGMNGEPLPIEHGFPARLVVPGLYGYVSATKWVTELKVTRFADDEGYWVPRGWTERGPIKLASRIDTPRGGSAFGSGGSVEAGEVMVAGVAWAQHTGVSRVEVQVDDGAWQEAELAEVVTVDTWVQWRWRWDATSGRHVIRVRATDAEGTVQTSASAPPAPDGATGWHQVTVSVK